MFLLRVLDIGTDPSDDRDLVVRKRTSVAAALAFCVASAWYTVLSILADRPLVLGFSIVSIIGQLLNLWVFHRTRRFIRQAVVMNVLGLTIIFTGILTLGGLTNSAGNAVWLVLAPMGAVLLNGARAGLLTLIGVAAVVIVGALLDPLIPDDQALPELAALLLTVANLLAPATVALGLVVFIDGERLAARRQSDALLLNVLPEPIANRLKLGERVIADHYDQASVLFADIVNFTPLSESKSPQDVVSILNGLFIEFDRLAERFGLEKIKTIGDAYMVVAGVPAPREDHAAVLMEMALAMHACVLDYAPVDGRHLEIRIGIASGPLVAGVIGERKFSYDLWGDTVNTASRMESSGVSGRIQVTEETRRLLADRYPFLRREDVEVKGKGRMSTWVLDPATL
jgi:class 3 adenylate cyclase